MTLRPMAREDLRAIARGIEADSVVNAARFMVKVLKAIEGLRVLPNGRSLARESPAFGYPIRQTVVKPYRIIFMVEADSVRVLRVYHSARSILGPIELWS